MSRLRSNMPGFVMPVVVLLALVGGLVVGVVLTRASQRAVITQQQLVAYQDAHRQFGMKAIITSWINYSQSVSLDELTGGAGGGDAFRTELPDGAVVEAAFFPAQDAVLIEPVGQDAFGARIVDAIRGLDLPARRPVGPLAVDALRTDGRAIASLLEAALEDGDAAADVAQAIQLARRDGELTKSDLDALLTDRGIDAAGRRNAARVITTEPSLWRVRTTYRPSPRTGGTPVVYEGYLDLPGGRVEFGSAISPNEVFLSWARVETGPGYTETD